LDYQPSSLQEAGSALERVESFTQRAARKLEGSQYSVEKTLPEDFLQAMEDDLNLPAALAVLHETVRDGNQAMDEQRLRDVSLALGSVQLMLEILGIEFEQHQTDSESQALAVLIEKQIELRAEARENKDFQLADQIREQLASAGITLNDDADGTSWSIDG